MKRMCARLVLMALLVSLVAVFPAMAAEGDVITTDKTEYLVGEPILVTATGAGNDWVGLYLESDYPQSTAVGGQPSIRWYYVARDGNASGDTKNMFNAEYTNSDRPDLISVPAGNYKVVLLANDGYEVLGEVYITVKDEGGDAPDTPDTPEIKLPTATYTSAGAGTGRADGTVTVKAAAGGAEASAYVLRWGNASGPIEGYTAIAEVKATGAETKYEMTPNTLVPVGADRVLVYTRVGGELTEAVAAMLPDGAGDYELGTALYEIQVMSDIHINVGKNHIHNRHFAAALEDIKQLSPNSLGIFVNGDIADHGQKPEYDAFRGLIEAAGEGVPPVYAAIGNHDLDGGQGAAGQIKQFLAGTGNDSETVYFDRVIDGVHFVFLGSEEPGLYATLSRAQLDWLEETLEADKEAGRPVFLFLHQGIMDTVAGTFEYQGWHGIHSPGRLKKILGEHPEVVMFAGHSHWMLESTQSLKLPDDKLPTVLNTASCAYLWDDGCMTTNTGIVGSQGYYIYVYEDTLVFRGRNFDTGEWIPSAQFVMDWTLKAADTPAETTGDETESATEPTTAAETTATTEGGDEPADTAPVTEAETDGIADKGCASALSGMLFSLLGALAAALVLRRRD